MVREDISVLLEGADDQSSVQEQGICGGQFWSDISEVSVLNSRRN